MKYVCSICGYVYNPAEGDPDSGWRRHALRGTARRLGLPGLRRRQGRVRSRVIGAA